MYLLNVCVTGTTLSVDPLQYRAAYAQDTLKDISKRTLHRPELLQWNEKENQQKRLADRNNLFLVYPELMVIITV